MKVVREFKCRSFFIYLALSFCLYQPIHADPIDRQARKDAIIDYKSYPPLNPFLFPRTGIFYGMLFTPTLYPKLLGATTIVSPATRYGIKVDMPVNNFYSSGFVVNVDIYKFEGIVQPQLLDITQRLDMNLYQTSMGLSLLNKFFYDISLGSAGRLGFFGEFTAGPSLLILPLFELQIREKSNFITDNNNLLGAGINLGATAGIEYYPIQRLGFFIEGGINYFAWWQGRGEQPEYSFIQLYAPTLQFGIKLVT